MIKNILDRDHPLLVVLACLVLFGMLYLFILSCESKEIGSFEVTTIEIPDDDDCCCAQEEISILVRVPNSGNTMLFSEAVSGYNQKIEMLDSLLQSEKEYSFRVPLLSRTCVRDTIVDNIVKDIEYSRKGDTSWQNLAINPNNKH